MSAKPHPVASEKLIRRALELVRDGLRSGEIPAHNFNMERWRLMQGCHSMCCIGGWAAGAIDLAGNPALAKHLRYPQDLFLNDHSGLNALFYPVDLHSKTRTPKQAAAAIDRYLNGQEPWPQVAA